jgi:hypothetical protein
MSESTTNDETYQRIQSQIAHDMAPVKRLSSVWLRAAFVLPYALIALATLLIVLGLRADAGDLSPQVLWGLGSLQLLFAFFVFCIALKHAVPGETVGMRVWLSLPLLALLVITAVAQWTHLVSPMEIPGERVLTYGMACFGLTFLFGLVPLVVGLWLLSRGLTLRPRVAGLLIGLGGGLLAEAVYRMHCPFSNLSHVLPWHGGAVLLLGLMGLFAGIYWETRELRQWERRHRSSRS